MQWTVILWTCITVGVLVCIAGIIMALVSARNVKKKTSELGNVHTELKVGSEVMFAGGLYGKVTKIQDEVVWIEIAKNVVVKASRFSIQQILKKQA